MRTHDCRPLGIIPPPRTIHAPQVGYNWVNVFQTNTLKTKLQFRKQLECVSESHFKSTSTNNHVTKTNRQRTALFSDCFPRTLLRESPLKQLLYSCQTIKQTQYKNFKGKFNHGICYFLNLSNACTIYFLIIVFILTYL